MPKVSYTELPFKTNRNALVRNVGPNVGVRVPKNVHDRMRKRVRVTDIALPSKVYHVSRQPISEFTADRIFYVSFDEFQSLAHGFSLAKNDIHPFSTEKLYFYVLRPKKRIAKAVVFDQKYRPKNVSNALGIKYNTFSKRMSMVPQQMNRNNVVGANFREGSGDNMIFGHILCKHTNVNGVRDEINQNEFAVCNPKNFFDVVDRRVLSLKNLANVHDIVRGVTFERTPKSYRYQSNHANNLTKLFKQRSKVNVRPIFNKNNLKKPNGSK